MLNSVSELDFGTVTVKTPLTHPVTFVHSNSHNLVSNNIHKSAVVNGGGDIEAFKV